MTRAELLALAERVENAAGPDRELDAEIAIKLAVPIPFSADEDGCMVQKMGDVPRYTASIDAAASLVPDGEGFALVYNAAKVGIWTGKGKTPALALLAAALFARAEEAAWNESGDRVRAEEAGE